MLVGTYGPVKVLRPASQTDLKALGVGVADAEDLKALRRGDLFVIAQEDGSERLYHRGYLAAMNNAAVTSAVLGGLDVRFR